jgi:hypothetical protein
VDEARAVATRYRPEVVEYLSGHLAPFLDLISVKHVEAIPEIVREVAVRHEAIADRILARGNEDYRVEGAVGRYMAAMQCFGILDDGAGFERVSAKVLACPGLENLPKNSYWHLYYEIAADPESSVEHQLRNRSSVSLTVATKAISARLARGDKEGAVAMAQNVVSLNKKSQRHDVNSDFADVLLELGLEHELSVILMHAIEEPREMNDQPELFLHFLALGDEKSALEVFQHETIPSEWILKVLKKWDPARHGERSRLTHLAGADMMQQLLVGYEGTSNPGGFVLLLAEVQSDALLREMCFAAISRHLESQSKSRLDHVSLHLLRHAIPSPWGSPLDLSLQRRIAGLVSEARNRSLSKAR